MSDIAKSFARSKLAALPPEPPLQEDQEDHDEHYSSASSMSSTGTVRPTSTTKRKPLASTSKSADGSDSLPSWTEFFDQELYLQYGTDTHNAQYHVYVVEPRRSPANQQVKDPILVLHHGAGSSALSFALFVSHIRKLLPNVGIVAVEARDHGDSTVRDAKTGEFDKGLSIETLSKDLALMVRLTASKLKWFQSAAETGEDISGELPPILLIGHSLGGAVVTHAAKHDTLAVNRTKTPLIGFVVIDAVEGSAVDALKHMRAYLASRPSVFDSIDSAVDWHLKTKVLRNIGSARISVPSLFLSAPSANGKLIWRTDLSRTEDYWTNWFTGMSGKFLGALGAKMLILAGTDRLDREMMIGQMQGKFQLQVVPEAGHFVQEDSPEKTAGLVAEFFKRNDRSALVLPPKVSDLLAQGKKV